MEIRDPLDPKPRNFYDGGPFDGQPDPGAEPRILLERVVVHGKEQFTMGRRIAYRDRERGELLVPKDPATFFTDLTSVPTILTWLVPRTGEHLPAALLHDGLISRPGEPDNYLSTEHHAVDRVEADRVFRDAMADRGTGLVRRWLIWSAVTLGTIFGSNELEMGRPMQWRYRLTMAGTLLVVVYVGFCATLDLADADWPGFVQLPWMGDRDWWEELLGGAGGAISVPFLLGFLWGRFRVAGWLDGITVSLLIHVMIFLVALTVLYRATEWLTKRNAKLALGIYLLVVAIALGVFITMSAAAP